jgi:hypothetical protein
MRQVREGLEVLGINSDAVLHHATPRLFYACELHDHARPGLLGLETGPVVAAPKASAVAEAWRVRWLANRSKNPEILTQVAQFAPEQLAMSLVGPEQNDQLDLALA